MHSNKRYKKPIHSLPTFLPMKRGLQLFLDFSQDAELLLVKVITNYRLKRSLGNIFTKEAFI